MDVGLDSAESNELDKLADLVERYEDERMPMPLPSPAATGEFYLDQDMLSLRDLVPIIGSETKVAEVLSGNRQLTTQMACDLHKQFGMPEDIQRQGLESGRDEPVSVVWRA